MENSTITLKTKAEIAAMREGGKVLATILDAAKQFAKPGVDTKSIDNLVGRLCLKYRVKPSFLNYDGYPANICISLNDEVVHGIPSIKRIIADGDLVSLDFGVIHKGFHTDSAFTFVAGQSNSLKDRLIEVTEKSFWAGIKKVAPGNHLGDVSKAIEEKIDSSNFSVVRSLAGHGVGRHLHESPIIPNYGKKGTGPILAEGMTLAIEPMVCEGKYDLFLKDDGWTYATSDGKLSAHFEHSIAVTANGCEILTQI